MLRDVLQVSNVKVAEHLSQGLQECSRVQEIIQCSDSTHGVVHEFEIELEQLQSKVDHLKAQVSVNCLLHSMNYIMPYDVISDYQDVSSIQFFAVTVV